MKKWGALIMIPLIMGCERFPSNPETTLLQGPSFTIKHETTEYIEVDSGMEGLAADKVNILTFSVEIMNENLSFIEFLGVAMLNGPPEYGQHAIHFRTDSLNTLAADLGVHFEQLTELKTDTTYMFKRPFYPTNEYAPFEANRGRVERVTISEIRAYDESGHIYRLDPIEN